MKYSFAYFTNSKCIDKADEIRIKVTPKNSAAGLLKFAEEHAEQRLVLDVRELGPDILTRLADFRTLKTIHNNFTLLLDNPEFVTEIHDVGLEFYFNIGVDTWDMLIDMSRYSVSDVLIVGEMCFQLPDVSAFCHDHRMNVRVRPNLAQVSSPFIGLPTDITAFFIRPEDELFYENYVDYYQFYYPHGKGIVLQDVLYRIYTSHKWLDNLRYIITNLDVDIFSDRVIPQFGYTRTDCAKRCQTGRCNVCPSMVKFSQALLENVDMRIKIDYPNGYKGITYEEYLKEIEKSDDVIVSENIEDDIDL